MAAKILSVFAITFLPIGLFTYLLIRHTAKSLGDQSPLFTLITYKIYDQAYFTRFDFLFLIFYVTINLVMLYAIAFVAFPSATVYWHWLIVVLGLAVSLVSLWFSMLLFRLNWQYWLITRGKTVTLNPADKSLQIATEEETVRITAADVVEIEKHFPYPLKMRMLSGYKHLVFKLKDGQTVYLNYNNNYLLYAIDAYFKNVPIKRIPHKIPWIVAP